MLEVLSKTFPGRAAWFFASNAANVGISFLTMILLARVLSPAEYGVLAVYFTFTAVVTAIAGLSLDGSVSVAVFKRTSEEVSSHVASGVVLVACVYGSIAAILAIVGEWLTSVLGIALPWLMIGLACGFAQSIANVKLALWMAKGDARQYATFQVVQSGALAALTAVLVVAFRMGWEGRAWAQLAVVVTFGCAAFMLIWRNGECSRRVQLAEMRSVLGFGVPLLPHIGGLLLFSSADRFIVNGLLGPAATGLYQFAAQIGSVVLILTDALNKAFAPWMYKHLAATTEVSRRRIVVLTYAYFLVALGVGVLAFVQPWNLAALLGGDAYAAAGPLVAFSILGHCFGGMYFMVVNYIFFSGKTGNLSVATLATGAIGTAAMVVLTGIFGVLGAALAFSAGKMLHFGVTWLISARLHPMPWRLRQI